MKHLFLFLTILFLSCKTSQENPEKDLQVLFIGNSLTFYHDMPQTLQKMLEETHPNIKIDQITIPGISLHAHLENMIVSNYGQSSSTRPKKPGEITETEKKIAEKDWDVIILQTGTVRVLIPEVRESHFNKAIQKVKSFSTNPNVQLVLFNTWPSKSDYPKEYCYPGMLIDPSLEGNTYCSPKTESLEQELCEINYAYQTVANQNRIEKTNHGDMYYKIYKDCPEIKLLDDSFHPSALGSFLNACIFYEFLTGNDAKSLKYTGEIDSNIADVLKKYSF